MALDPRFNEESVAYTQFMKTDFPPPTSLTIDAIRQRSELLHSKVNEKLIGTFQGSEHNRDIPISNNTNIPVTIYVPTNAIKQNLVVFFHGGGFTMNSRKTHQTIVNMLADATKSIWVSVEYRLGPEYKFPIWLDDGCEVTKYIIDHKAEFGGDETTKVGVGGDSAGGLIAASICYTLKNVDFQILVYGAFDFSYENGSFEEFIRPEYVLTPKILAWFRENALRNKEDGLDPRASVLRQPSSVGLPPCLFIVAELDPLRDQNYAYQKKLEEAGVRTKFVLIKNVIHAFFSLPGIYKNACGEAVAAVQEFMASL